MSAVTSGILAPSLVFQCNDLLLDKLGTFRENNRRNLSLAELPARLAGWSAILQVAENLARLRAGIPMNSDAHILGSKNYDRHLSEKFADEYKKAHSEIGGNRAITTACIKQLGLSQIDILIRASAANIDRGLEALLTSVILGSWTTFEALVADIWEIALNFGPKEWVSAILRSPPPEDSSLLKRQEKTLSISALSEAGYDFREKMGTVLIQQKKVNFQSLKGIRFAFESVFGDAASRIFDENSELVSLSAVRNLYAHSGGNVDEVFCRQMKKHPTLSNVPLGSYLKPDGELAKMFLEVAMKSGVELVQLVDDKLATHLGRGTDPFSKHVVDTLRRARKDPSDASYGFPSKWSIFKHSFFQLFRRD